MTIVKDKISEIFCMADDFCLVYDRFIKMNGLAPKRDKSKRKYHRDGMLSDAEVITMMILFHLCGYKCLKHFYLNEVCENMTDLFPHTVSYNRFVELEQKVTIPFILIPYDLQQANLESNYRIIPFLCRRRNLHLLKTR